MEFNSRIWYAYVFFVLQSGPDLTTEETWGVNYRALGDLFKISKERVQIVRYEVAVQMIEIYNEQVRDLLVNDGSNRRYPFKDNYFQLFFNFFV